MTHGSTPTLEPVGNTYNVQQQIIYENNNNNKYNNKALCSTRVFSSHFLLFLKETKYYFGKY